MLLETVLSGKPQSWGKLLHADRLLNLLSSLLVYRKSLETALMSAAARGSGDSNISAKKSLLDRIDALISSKLLKAKFASLPWGSSDAEGLAKDLQAKFAQEIRTKSSKQHKHFASQGLVALLKAVPDNDARVSLGGVYRDMVKEWSEKKSSKIEVVSFEDLIHMYPSLAQRLLTGPLAEAVTDCRSNYRKAEALQLLSLLLNPNVPDAGDDNENRHEFYASLPRLGATIVEAMKDTDMRKAKRQKDVLKTCGKLVSFLEAHPAAQSKMNKDVLTSFVASIEEMKQENSNKGTQSTCESVLVAIARLSDEWNEGTDASNPAADDDEDGSDSEEMAVVSMKKSAKSKKKKKSKKKR